MNPEEALRITRLAKALSPAQALDDFTPDAWALILAPYRYEDAERALRELGAEQEWIHVSHIVKRIKRLRSERIRRNEDLLSPPPGLTEVEYLTWLRKTRAALGDGEIQHTRALATPSAERLKAIESFGERLGREPA